MKTFSTFRTRSPPSPCPFSRPQPGLEQELQKMATNTTLRRTANDNMMLTPQSRHMGKVPAKHLTFIARQWNDRWAERLLAFWWPFSGKAAPDCHVKTGMMC
mmetsp:Transcript_54329/g.117582  ORF Transcript_54329/g.117582 Transcript_54329/m.117582 type:complete len:102 (+) Transcript_54329:806-1111(+)